MNEGQHEGSEVAGDALGGVWLALPAGVREELLDRWREPRGALQGIRGWAQEDSNL